MVSDEGIIIRLVVAVVVAAVIVWLLGPINYILAAIIALALFILIMFGANRVWLRR